MSSKILYGAIALLMVDSIMELSFISSMVAWLHRRPRDPFEVNDPNGGTFFLHVKPVGLLLNQGHTSNGAAGTAFVAIGMGGILALWLRHRQLKRERSLHGFTSFLYNFWLVMTVLSALLSFSAFVAVMAITYQHANQKININLASTLYHRSPSDYPSYPDLMWTPQNWFAELLRLPLTKSSDRSTINLHLAVMHAWEWNLIPMTIVGFVVATLAFLDRRRQRQRANTVGSASRLESLDRQKQGSPYS